MVVGQKMTFMLDIKVFNLEVHILDCLEDVLVLDQLCILSTVLFPFNFVEIDFFDSLSSFLVNLLSI